MAEPENDAQVESIEADNELCDLGTASGETKALPLGVVADGGPAYNFG